MAVSKKTTLHTHPQIPNQLPSRLCTSSYEYYRYFLPWNGPIGEKLNISRKHQQSAASVWNTWHRFLPLKVHWTLRQREVNGQGGRGERRGVERDEANWIPAGCRSGSTDWRMEGILQYKGKDKFKSENVGWMDGWDEGQINDGLNGWLVARALTACVCVCVCSSEVQIRSLLWLHKPSGHSR